jgi:hypothetical protein
MSNWASSAQRRGTRRQRRDPSGITEEHELKLEMKNERVQYGRIELKEKML